MEMLETIYLTAIIVGICVILLGIGIIFKKKFPNTLLLFVTPPSGEELINRLRSRNTETEDEILRRIQRADEEVEWIQKYDYLVINDKLDECVDSLHNIIVSAHNTPNRQQDLIEKIKKDLDLISKGE